MLYFGTILARDFEYSIFCAGTYAVRNSTNLILPTFFHLFLCIWEAMYKCIYCLSDGKQICHLMLKLISNMPSKRMEIEKI